MKDYKRIEHMRNLNDSLIWERMKRCYDFGYEDGKADTPFTDTEEAEKKAYDRGLNDAWEVIKKITKDDSVGGYSIKMMQELFGRTCVYDITHNYTPEEALAKIKAYEDKQKQDDEIKVGDEVRIIGSNPETDDCDYGICTKTKSETIYVMRKDGSVGEENKAEWYKTGRHFDAIAEVLKEMRGAENDE